MRFAPTWSDRKHTYRNNHIKYCYMPFALIESIQAEIIILNMAYISFAPIWLQAYKLRESLQVLLTYKTQDAPNS